jgi:hypothetical protein
MGVNFTVPAADSQSTLLFCLNGHGSSGEQIRAFCSWSMGSLGILPRVNIGLPNGTKVFLTVRDIHLAIYGIQTGNVSTTGGVHTLSLFITPGLAINGSAIGCSEARIPSTKTTFIARHCENESSITYYASTATTVLPTQTTALLPMTTMKPPMSSAPTPSSTPTPSLSAGGLAIAIIFPIIFVIALVIICTALGILAEQKYGCISKKWKTNKEAGGDPPAVPDQGVSEQPEEPHPYNNDSPCTEGSLDNRSRLQHVDEPQPLDPQPNVADSEEHQPDMSPADGPEHVFNPVHDCPYSQLYTPVSIPPDDSEILPDSISERVPGDPLRERIDSGNETMPRNRQHCNNEDIQDDQHQPETLTSPQNFDESGIQDDTETIKGNDVPQLSIQCSEHDANVQYREQQMNGK